MNTFEIFQKVLETHKIKDIAELLDIAVGTIKRWKDLKNVPDLYKFQLLKLNNDTIDYSQYNYKSKDQYFTPLNTAKYCYEVLCKVLKEYKVNEKKYKYIEPSVGSGVFLDVLPKKRIYDTIDIESKLPNVKIMDYTEYKPNKEGNYIVIGNPPFGLRGQLALKFINHSYEFADFICFILPQLFESDGKGSPRKRVKGYNLIHSEKLNTDFFDPDNNQVKVNCILQILSKHHKNEKYEIKEKDDTIMKILSLSNGDKPSQKRNVKMLYNCDIYVPSTCFGKEKMRYYESFDELPNKRGYGVVFVENKEENLAKFKNIKWDEIAFLSTNSAYNLRLSAIMNQFN